MNAMNPKDPTNPTNATNPTDSTNPTVSTGYSECQKFVPIVLVIKSPCPPLSKGELKKACGGMSAPIAITSNTGV